MKMNQMKEKENAAKNWVKEHKTAIKYAMIFAGGVIVGGAIERAYWTIPDESPLSIYAIKDIKTHDVGLKKDVLTRNGKRIRQNVSSVSMFNSYEEAERVANDISAFVKEGRSE